MKRERQSEKQRAGYIGGSDAAVILGMNPWKNRVQLWQEKTGQVPGPDLEGNARVQWGIKLEDMVARHWAEVTGQKIRRNNFLLRSERWPWMGAHLDRQVKGGGFLEVKTAGMEGEWGPSGSSIIPDHYFCQVQHYMAVTDDEKCWVAVLISGSDFRHYTIDRNDEFISVMAAAQEAFWQLVQDGTPPHPTTVDEAQDRWRAAEAGKVVQANADVMEWLHAMGEIDVRMKALKGQQDELKMQLMNHMGDAEVLMAANRKQASWKNQTANRMDTTALKKAMPDVAAQFMKESTTRVFRLH